MILPRFHITQDEEFVHVHINVPYVRIGSAEVVCDEREFSFYCKPYLLKLTLPHPCDGTDEERCKASYDPAESHGTLVAHLPKVTPGLHFPDLDLTTKLMQMRRPSAPASTATAATATALSASGPASASSARNGIPSIQVLSSTEDDTDGVGDIEASIPLQTEEDLLRRLQERNIHYGFNRKYSLILGRFEEEMADIIELPDPDQTAERHRRGLRLRAENRLFDCSRYLGDFYGGHADPICIAAMAFQPFWVRFWEHWQAAVRMSKAAVNAGVQSSEIASQAAIKEAAFESPAGGGGFNDEDRLVMAQEIGNREYMIDSSQQQCILRGLIDLLFSYSFDVRCTEGDPTVESAYNVTRCSAFLSWMDDYGEKSDSCHTVICSLMRRVCIYPYMRFWKLGRKVLTDVARMLYLGKRCVLKCLLGLRAIFHSTDTHYLLNKIIIDDYCCWIQSADEETLQVFAREFNNAKTAFEKSEFSGKAAVGLQLCELEQWAEGRREAHGEDRNDEDAEEIEAHESVEGEEVSSSEGSDSDSDSDSHDDDESGNETESGDDSLPAPDAIFNATNRDTATAMLSVFAAPVVEEEKEASGRENSLTDLLSEIAITNAPPPFTSADESDFRKLPLIQEITPPIPPP